MGENKNPDKKIKKSDPNDKNKALKNKKSTKSKPKKVKKKKKIVFKVIYITLLLLIVAGIAAGFGVVGHLISKAPELDVNLIMNNGETTLIYDDKGEEIDEYKSPEKRISVKSADVPQYLKDAFVSIEDQRFYEHEGIDIRRLGGAVIQDIKIILGLSNAEIQGASTITQQLIKYKYFLVSSMEDRTSIERKVQEIYLAINLEKELSKEQILEAYMNTILLGGNAYGIEAAANMYFDLSVGELTLKQCAFLASAAQNPYMSYTNSYAAFEKGEPFDSPRTALVLGKMLELGKISQAEYDEAMATPLTFTFTNTGSNVMNYEWFSRPVVKQVAKDLVETYGYTETEAYDKISYGGLRIYTTMDKALQDNVQQIMNDFLAPYPGVQGSGAIVDYVNGETKALIGGVGEHPAMSYNRAISVGNDGQTFLRAFGSSIKPLTVYGPAIDSQILTAGSVFVDGPLPRDIGSKYTSDGSTYSPTNLPNRYDGYITVREAIRQSKNTTAVSIVDKIGLSTSVAYAEKFGLSISENNKTSISALALGEIDGTTPHEMAQAFGTFGNQGVMNEARIYTKVTDKDGKVLLEPQSEGTQVLSPQAAYITYDMMKESIAFTGPSAIFGGMEVRGKTGTSEDFRNLTFAGLTPYYSGAIWLGYDDNSPLPGPDYNAGLLGLHNSDRSAALWGQMMKAAHEGLEYKELQQPGGISYVSISKDSGTLPTDLTSRDPRGNRIYTEMFINGTQPTTLDDVHVELEVVKGADGKYYFPSEKTPKDKLEKVVFITRDKNRYPTQMSDSKYLAPDPGDKDPTEYKEEKPKDEENKDPNKPEKPEKPEKPDKPENPGGGNGNDTGGEPGEGEGGDDGEGEGTGQGTGTNSNGSTTYNVPIYRFSMYDFVKMLG